MTNAIRRALEAAGVEFTNGDKAAIEAKEGERLIGADGKGYD